MLKFDITNIPILAVTVSSDDLDEKQLYDLAYNTIEPQIERINGVASATVGGGKVREIEVMADANALRARGLGILDLANAVRTSNLLLPSGSLRAGDRDYNVFTNTQVPDVAPLRNVVVRSTAAQAGQGQGVVRVGDVAKVEDLAADQTEIVRVNGQRGVYLRVLKQPGANTISTVDAVRAAIPRLRSVPSNVKLNISFDQSAYIRSAVAALQHEALQGGALAILVILVFLMNIRATAIIAVAIPLSIVATFMLLFFTNQTLNVFTLGGLALGVGRLVDDSIVELENIHRHLASGQNRKQAVLLAAQEVAMPILVSTITTIVVFFPVLFMAFTGSRTDRRRSACTERQDLVRVDDELLGVANGDAASLLLLAQGGRRAPQSAQEGRRRAGHRVLRSDGRDLCRHAALGALASSRDRHRHRDLLLRKPAAQAIHW